LFFEEGLDGAVELAPFLQRRFVELQLIGLQAPP
jgi:hypothetical protein